MQKITRLEQKLETATRKAKQAITKRIAYIGLSYPLFYDYMHQADRCANDISDSPNPIIESPLGLMIFYDEILFLCKSLCPNNMRNLPYVKFVDELYPDFYFADILELAKSNVDSVTMNSDFSYAELEKRMGIRQWGPDGHTHGIKICDITKAACSNAFEFVFDLYVVDALRELYDKNIEFITNSRFSSEELNAGAKVEFIDKIIIPQIPNYVGIHGPYHECMEELRNNKYLTDFRKWIIEEHNHLQRSEIDEMCSAVEHNMIETRENIFRKYLEENSGFSFFKSTGSTIIKTAAGIKWTRASVLDATVGILVTGKKSHDARNLRWQGFVMDSRNVVNRDSQNVNKHHPQ